MILSFVVLGAVQLTPLEIGRKELEGLGATLSVRKNSKEKEAFTISSKDGKVTIVGSDETGAMYGAFEYAERVRNGEKNVNVSQKPYLRDRGLNLFLTLPWDYKKNDTDYDPAALTDPERWWFQNDDYWQTLLDLMAHSRLNWLDIHGTWDISVTDAPNLYAYFVRSPSFGKVGVSDEIKAFNMKRLNKVISMAHERGIRVSLMAYQASLKIPQNPNPPYEGTEANVYKYTREAVEQMIRLAPGLDAIGFRIGESGKGESFFKCYGEAVKASGREIPLITRSWITRKQAVLPLARASKDFTVQIKYNGEQWGAPYMVAGGRVANWYSYSFEDYLSDSTSGRKSGRAAKMWPGWPEQGRDGSENHGRDARATWPSQPYKIVWQVRANGTHRIFPFYNPEWVRRTILCMKIGTASGYTIEGLDAYYPKSPDYYLANPADKYCNWIHQRDEMYWMTWGRLGYDPSVKDEVFDRQAARTLGKDASLIPAWKSLSAALPLAFLGFSLGPDHRSHAPELEWGGPVESFIQGQGFDSHGFIPINERLANQNTGGLDGRLSLGVLANSLRETRGSPTPSVPLTLRGKEIQCATEAMVALKEYYTGRIESASALAYAEERVAPDIVLAAQMDLGDATNAYRALSSIAYYKPFTERLRMHTNDFSWRSELLKLEAEKARWDVHKFVANLSPAFSSRSPQLRLEPPFFRITSTSADITCRFSQWPERRAWILVKPLASSTYFHRIPMRLVQGEFTVTIPRENVGHAIALEFETSARNAERWPDPRSAAPYLIIPSKAGPTPQIYNAEEAMTYLRPSAITSENYSGMLLGTRAWNFFSRFSLATKRKVLDPVERGMRLVILQQDFNRYKLDWLPKPLNLESGNWTTFDPGGQLGLEKVETKDAMWQRFKASEGWEVFGNGGLARLKLGKGEVWVCSARLMQRMHIPSAARAFVRLLSLGGKEKPTILIDSCSEGADGSSSCHPDLMNSHDIPFLTLGEVIAKEQGMDSFTPIPGPIADEDVLEGKGSQMANAFLRAQVVTASKRPVPPNLAAFEIERMRRKAELMRCLGLDPLPPRIPLNARVTGVIQRSGYRIEKVVFESRPKFYVTAHVYVPDLPLAPPGERGPGGEGLPPLGGDFAPGDPSPPTPLPERGEGDRLPVVVHVNGHWAHKKGEDRLQLRAAFCAIQGYIAIAIDSPGHSFEGNSLIERQSEGSHNDWALFQGGTNATGIYVWDTMRALDYMATRPDTDMSRVGLTGASGGGLAALYTFAADDRYKAAVPVVYMASMELAPDNGCLCNHVPGTCQIGDRSDVMAIQAPKPVYLMGAENDPEFPMAATLRTQTKMEKEWRLFATPRTEPFVQIFEGPHDYNQKMREAMIGFFNKHLKGLSNGSPVKQPPIEVIDPENRQLLVLDPPPSDERTMRDIALENLTSSRPLNSPEAAILLNGGRPTRTDLKYKESGPASKRAVVFEAEPGLQTPGVLVPGASKGVTLTICVSDQGKKPQGDSPTLYLDVLGVGELANIEMRYPVYLGRSIPFEGGWQIVRAVEAFRNRYRKFRLVAGGPISSQAVMWAALLQPGFESVSTTNALEAWEDAFKPGFPPAGIQPRANLLPKLADLRKLIPRSKWK